MPLVPVDMLEGRSPDEIKALLDTTQPTVVAAFKVPQPDQYQVVHQHPASTFIVEDTGLGILRTSNCVFFHFTTRGEIGRRRRNFTTCYAASWRQRAA